MSDPIDRIEEITDAAEAALEGIPRRRQPTTSRPFFQRAIRAFTTRLSDDGRELVDTVTLSCGHVKAYVRDTPAPPGATASPCYDCGSGTRGPSTKERERAALELAVRRALEDPARLAALLDLLNAARKATTFRAGDQRRERQIGTIGRLALLAGLLEAPESHAGGCGDWGGA